MTVVYIALLWVALSFFLTGLWILGLEVGRWFLSRSARASASDNGRAREFADWSEPATLIRRERLPR